MAIVRYDPVRELDSLQGEVNREGGATVGVGMEWEY